MFSQLRRLVDPLIGVPLGIDVAELYAQLDTLPSGRSEVDGKYRLDRLIGKGGMGAVYEATDLRLTRSVAVKIMLGRALGDHQAMRRFEGEAQATARLAHPNIVTVFDFGAVGADGAFIVMEFVLVQRVLGSL